MKTKKIYFKNLDALRFIAALVVLLSHVGQFTDILGYSKNFTIHFTPLVTGETGVLLFFALSGFLITYLLLAEENITGAVSVKKFYIRRVLRIWPLYFLTVLLALFVYPFVNFLHFNEYGIDKIWINLPLKILFYCIFMPAVVMDFLGFVPYASHTWTIGAEEQFYFLWPILIKKIKNKFAVIAGVTVIYLAIYYALYFFGRDSLTGKNLFLLWTRYPISCMAIGGAYAWLALAKNNFCMLLQKRLFNIWCQLFVYTALLFFIINKVHLSHFNNEVYAILLGYLVFNIAVNSKTLFNIENRVFNYLGKISFGIYMFHPVGIVAAIKWCLCINCASGVLLYLTAIIFTIIPAVASYHLYEVFFIRKKAAFSVIASGN